MMTDMLDSVSMTVIMLLVKYRTDPYSLRAAMAGVSRQSAVSW